jgi:hypothetical protein
MGQLKAVLATFLDAGKVGGYVRAGVATGLGLAVAKVPVLGAVMDPATQAALGVFLSGLAVGIWSHYVKT